MSELAQMEQTENTENTERENPPADAPSGFLRSGAGRWILLAAIVAVVIGGYFGWQYYSVRESTDDAEIDGHIHPISAKEFGTVIHVNVDDNQFVNAGTVLVEFDPRDYRVALDKAQADLEEAEAALAASHTDVPIT
ncbi:MAG: biotin/lipoyl-binding protein, partial [Bryobacteraceae bacterium]